MATITNTGRLHIARGNAVVADVNATHGLLIVPPRAGVAIIVVDAWFRNIGTASDKITALEVQSSVTDVVIISVAKAALTSNVINRIETSGVTATNVNISSAVSGCVPAGEGLVLITTGTDEDVATSYDYVVEFIYVAA